MSGLRASVRPLAAPLKRIWIGRQTADWPPYSRLFVVEHSPQWVLSEEARALEWIAGRLSIPIGPLPWYGHVRRQCIFFLSQFSLLRGPWRRPRNRVAISYFHGRPGTRGFPEFDEAFESLRLHHEEIARVRVSSRETEELVLSSGIDPAKVFLIPIGVDTKLFALRTEQDQREARVRLGLPESAFVVGSLQKDGVGWEEGLEPKLIKGPDTLVYALARLRQRVPDLVVLLSGPARGYVKGGLERAGVPYRHVVAADYRDVPSLFHALDVCVIASRQEGGPKALLEAMATGVPVVSTRVGQAADLVRDRQNGWLVEIEDADGLADRLAQVAKTGSPPGLVDAARASAERESYEAQLPRWREFMSGFVEPGK